MAESYVAVRNPREARIITGTARRVNRKEGVVQKEENKG